MAGPADQARLLSLPIGVRSNVILAVSFVRGEKTRGYYNTAAASYGLWAA
jgi:hypothetical protein